ncbi:MAG: tRNA (adenosine(37)-N6)-dimethylallyltransferase MiaA [Bacteroidales bacterium]|nr:tRNA (adenosine(37)-N6)-dimethylallyltransferase MiaA [Bacteroidales bacterium]
MKKKLICLIGPTAVGKTDIAIRLATELNTEIISCDSRQIYKEMRIGTAVPEPHQLESCKHHFIGSASIHDYYSVFQFELDALQKTTELFKKYDQLVLTGGSGLYLDALIYGMDDIPDPDPEIRRNLEIRLEEEGIDSLRFDLKRLDPEYYTEVDLRNPKRVMRGLEVCLTTGQTFSHFRKRSTRERPFDHQIICLDRERSSLHNRINKRVDLMIESGLINEVKSLHPHKQLNALKTVGYRELFEAFEGKQSIEEAIELIKRNTRRYARRQITWNKRYKDAEWFDANEADKLISWTKNHLHQE